MNETTPFSDIFLSKSEFKALKSFLKSTEQEYSNVFKALIEYGFIKDKGKIINGYDVSSGIYIITQRGSNYIKFKKEQSVSFVIVFLTFIFSILAVIKEELLQLLQVIFEQIL